MTPESSAETPAVRSSYQRLRTLRLRVQASASFPPSQSLRYLAHHISGDLVQLFFGRNLLIQQKSLKAIDRIVLLFPVLDLAFRNITLIVVFGVALATISLGFNQDCAMTCARMFDCLVRDFIAGNDVVAIDDI